MRLPNGAHASHDWRIHDIAPDFELEDVWALPADGDAHDFAMLVDVLATLDTAQSDSLPARMLFAVRDRLGSWFGWDDAEALPIPGTSETTLRSRLPDDLRATPTNPNLDESRFKTVYLTDMEWAAEVSNGTVHAVLHLGWVPDGPDRYRGQMGVYVKPRGRFGAAYMTAIAPFRHLIVYPALMRQIEGAWQQRRVDQGRVDPAI